MMQQTREQSTPNEYFKPLTQSTAASIQNSSSTYFAPTSVTTAKVADFSLKEKEHGPDLQTDETLNVIHKRMYQETAKIRKWKLQTEFELKQKDGHLSEVKQTVESLRKSLLDLQLQNENLSLKLQDELANRDEISQKINSTRELCNVLKDYAAIVEVKLKECENEKNELLCIDEKQRMQYEELASSFESLEISAANNYEKAVAALKDNQKEKKQIQETYDEKLKEAELQLENLTGEKEQKDKNIELLSTQLQDNSAKLTELFKLNEELQQSLAEANEAYNKEMSQVKEVKEELAQTAGLKEQLQVELEKSSAKLDDSIINRDKLAKNFDETEKLYISKIEGLQNELTCVQEDIQKHIQKENELEFRLSETQKIVEELKCAKDMLLLERTEARSKINELELTKESLLKKHKAAEEDYNSTMKELLLQKDEISEEKNDIELRLLHYEEQVDRKIEEIDQLEKDIAILNKEIAEKENQIIVFQQKLQSYAESEEVMKKRSEQLASELEEEREKHGKLKQDNQTLTKEKQALEKEMNSTKKEIVKLNKEIDKVSTKQSRSKEEAQKSHAELEDAREELETTKEDYLKLNKEKLAVEKELNSSKREITKLHKEIEKISNKEMKTKTEIEKGQTELGEIRKQVEEDHQRHILAENTEKELTQQLKEAKQQISECEQQAKKREKEMKSAESTFNNKMKEMIATLDQYKKDGDKIVAQKIKELTESNNKLKTLNKQISECEQQTKKREKEMKSAGSTFDNKMKEMIATLDQYKKDNDKIVAQKTKELTESNNKLKILSKQGDSLDSLKEQLAETSNKLSAAEETLQNQGLALSDKEKIYEETNKQLKLKDEEIENMSQRFADLEKEKSELEENLCKENEELEKKLKELSTEHQELRRASKVAPVAPCTPCTPQMNRPLSEFVTPQNKVSLLRTPSHSILRVTNSVTKKRRVAFAPEEDGNDLDDPDDAASSSSEMGIEIEVDENDPALKTPNIRTPNRPLLIRPSPGGTKHSPMARVTGTPTTPKTVTKQPPKTQRSKRAKTDSPNTAETELAKFKELFPGANAKNLEKEGKPKKGSRTESSTAKNVRTAPTKPHGRIFKTPPKERRRFMKKKEEEIAWFDSDAVFGFGPED